MAVETREYRAEARFQRVSPQKARLVLELIKGRGVQEALDTAAFTKKRIAPVVHKLLTSAVDNAKHVADEAGIDLDVDNLYVKRAMANDGPRMKRIRPAPMGRAYRYQRRLTHIVLSVAERESAAGLVTKVEEPTRRGKPGPRRRKRKRRSRMQPRKRPARRPEKDLRKKHGTESPSLRIPAGREQAVAFALVL